MTKKEQTDWLCRLRAELNSRVIDTPWNKEFTEALTGILEQEPCEDATLKEIFCMECEYKEQQPCDDCISRQAVLELVADYDLSMGQVVKGIHALPPVTPQQKMGRWINQHIIYTNATVDFKVCSECRYEFSYDAETGVSDANYCPHCGAKMQEVQE